MRQLATNVTAQEGEVMPGEVLNLSHGPSLSYVPA